MTGWIIAGCVAVVLIIAACLEISGRWSRHEEREKSRLRPCPRSGTPPHLSYCCGEYFVHGDDPDCPYCGTAFTEMHSSEQMEMDAWNRRACQADTENYQSQ